MFHVYIDGGKYLAVETTGLKSVQEVEKLLPENVNWYGVDASSPEEAIQKAKEAGFKYVSPEKMKALNAQFEDLDAKIKEFLI